MTRPPKILLAIAGAAAFSMLLAAIVLPFVIDTTRVRAEAETRLRAALGRRVSVGEVRLSLWTGLAFRAASVRIGEPLDGSGRGALLATAGRTTVGVAWLPLLSRRVEARSISVSGLTVTQDGKPLIADCDLSSRLHFGPDATVETKGTVEGSIAAFPAAPRVRAAFAATLRHGNLEIPTVKATAGPLHLSASGRVADAFSQEPRLTLEGTGEFKRSQAQGTLDLVAAVAGPTATFDLSFPLLDAGEVVAAVARLAGHAPALRASALIVPQASAAEPGVAADPSSFVQRLTASGTMRADRCVARGLELTNLKTSLSIARGLAKLDGITFDVYGGAGRGSLTVSPFEARIPFSLDQTAEAVAIGPLIAALAPKQAHAVEGRAALAVRLSGEAGAAMMLPSLNGAGRLAIEEGRIASFGAVKQVLSALEVAGAKGIAREETPFDRLSATFTVAQGTAGTKDLQFRSPDLDGDGAGTVGLGGVLQLDVLASFSKTVSDALVEKTHALSIRQGADGRLTVPLQIRGTVQAPRVQLDLSKVINEGVLKQLRKEGAKSLVKKLLGQ